MSMDLFADRIGNVTVSEGVARIDFLRLEDNASDPQQRSYRFSHRLVLPLQTFGQLGAAVQQMREKIATELEAQKAAQPSQPTP
jgi:hypothetical protein